MILSACHSSYNNGLVKFSDVAITAQKGYQFSNISVCLLNQGLRLRSSPLHSWVVSNSRHSCCLRLSSAGVILQISKSQAKTGFSRGYKNLYNLHVSKSHKHKIGLSCLFRNTRFKTMFYCMYQQDKAFSYVDY